MTRPLRFATYLAPCMASVYRAVAAHVGERLDVPTELVVGTHHRRFGEGEGDVGFMCGPPYVDLADGAERLAFVLAAPVIADERNGGRPVYHSEVIVHRDHPAGSFAELRGASFAYNEEWSHSGCGVVRAHLAGLGEDESFFARIVRAGFHQRSIHLVRTRSVDAAAIDSQVLAIVLRDRPKLARDLRVIASLGPSQVQPVVAHRRLPTPLREEIRTILYSMHEDPSRRGQLARGLVERFVPANDRDYDGIRASMRLGASVRFDRPGRIAPVTHA